MTPVQYANNVVIPAALKMLPERMDSPEARAMLVAIGLQESKFEARVQGNGGPAHGFWQFEHGGGVVGVLNHAASKSLISSALLTLEYDFASQTSYTAIVHNDILACVFARLLLWTDPKALPKVGQREYSWNYYLNLWRPGLPHRSSWDAYYDEAWAINL